MIFLIISMLLRYSSILSCQASNQCPPCITSGNIVDWVTLLAQCDNPGRKWTHHLPRSQFNFFLQLLELAHRDKKRNKRISRCWDGNAAATTINAMQLRHPLKQRQLCQVRFDFSNFRWNWKLKFLLSQLQLHKLVRIKAKFWDKVLRNINSVLATTTKDPNQCPDCLWGDNDLVDWIQLALDFDNPGRKSFATCFVMVLAIFLWSSRNLSHWHWHAARVHRFTRMEVLLRRLSMWTHYNDCRNQ